jgi:hypothetical protein
MLFRNLAAEIELVLVTAKGIYRHIRNAVFCNKIEEDSVRDSTVIRFIVIKVV